MVGFISNQIIFKKLDTFIENLKAERNIFELLSGDFVVKGYYSFSHEHYFCFVQDYMMGGDFANILKLYTVTFIG
jgi:serine/threonine protein kinase